MWEYIKNCMRKHQKVYNILTSKYCIALWVCTFQPEICCDVLFAARTFGYYYENYTTIQFAHSTVKEF